MKSIASFVQQKTSLAILIIFGLGFLTGALVPKLVASSNSGKISLAVLSPKTEETVSGIVPIRAYYKTLDNPFLLIGEYKIDEGESRKIEVVRINDQEVAIIGAWDATRDPGKHVITVSLYKALKNGQKTLYGQSKLPVNVLLFQ